MLTGLLYSPLAFSQDEVVVEEEPTFTISGSIDTYFHSSFGTDADAPATSFANLPGFGLGMANLIASYSGEKVGFTADLVFGPRGYDAVFANEYTDQRIVNQLFAYVKLGNAVTLNMGQFNTFLGYEVISPTINANYSTSYMFSYGPFSHTGLRADFDFGSGWVAKLAIMNPTDFVEFNPDDKYTLGGQLGYTNDNGGIWLNVLSGEQPDGTGESTFQVDLTTGWNLTEAVYLGLNATSRTVDGAGFSGVAIYPKFTLSDAFALALRGEYFMVKEGYIEPFALDGDGDGSVLAVTVSGNISVGNLMIIPEVRIDSTSEDTFPDGDEEAKGSLGTFTLAAVYKF